MRVAIVGSGIAGLAAAHALADAADVVMFEAAARAGGHVCTVDVDGHAIDMGFIVHNRERYPQFCALLDALDIPTRPTTMSFSVVHGDLEWGSQSLRAMFAQRRRVVDLRHWRFLARVVRFLAGARQDLATSDRTAAHDRAVHDRAVSDRDLATHALVTRATLDDYLLARDIADELRDRFVVPLAAALWSLAPERCGEFPALTYLRFLEQHGMLSPIAPLRWHTIEGGSRRYVDALLARLARRRFTLRLATPVRRIDRDPNGVAVDGQRFDRVIVATHADTALRLLAAPTSDERRLLGAFRYSANRTVLHTDRSFLPRAPAAHAAWNYVADADRSRVAVTYSMSRLQGLPAAPNGSPYLVTLNPRREPRGVLHELEFMHPQLDRAALAAQAELPRIAGTHRTYFAGAHLGFGFHEDGMRAGLSAAARVLVDAVSGVAARAS
jgi:predicted NAD/FAD-binding protein